MHKFHRNHLKSFRCTKVYLKHNKDFIHSMDGDVDGNSIKNMIDLTVLLCSLLSLSKKIRSAQPTKYRPTAVQLCYYR